MNKVVTSAGLLALGAAALHAYDPEMTRAKSGRPFTVSAVVRGFYDDNPTTSPDKFVAGSRQVGTTPSGAPILGPVFGKPEGSFGVEVNPSIHVNLPLEQTFIRAGYVYSYRWYENRESSADQSHEFNALLRHTFSPRHDIAISDSFSFSDEPTVTDRFGIITSPTRTEATAYRNRGGIDYNLSLTEILALGLGYGNTWYDYAQTGGGSRSALLDRMEHILRADLRYQVSPTLVGLIGYQFGMNDYTGSDFIYANRGAVATNLVAGGMSPKAAAQAANAQSDTRNSYSHYLYLGADHDFNGSLRGSIRLGGQFVDYYNTGESDVSPYADASLSYVYLPGSSAQFGVRHTRNATDIVAPDAKGRPTLDQETTAVYFEINHQITRNLKANASAQAQFSSFSSGAADSRDENLYLFGINLTYEVSRHWSVETGLSHDILESDQNMRIGGRTIETRSYNRSRVYVGVRGTY
ncbi:MAG TPA: outer membrane beta-barrel protein [Pyrinomonadaceae bacterium]|nr:outer membrane beta-barrel protein [Pyrinomonadaceae bacterium]